MAEPTIALPTPPPDAAAATAWVADHLGDLTREGPAGVAASPRFRGGQTAADRALASWDVTGYAARRNEVLPEARRGASALSPYVRYGLLGLRRLHAHVADAPPRDSRKFRDELLWQEYARHLYARLGHRTATALRHTPPRPDAPWRDPWPREMACVATNLRELETDGWLVNQTRMWLASQWTVRAGAAWRDGEDRFFTHLLDGSRAANRLGWQWTVGAGTGRPYGFSRRQVRKRAPGLCDTCALRDACPIEDWPAERGAARVEALELLRADPDLAATAGPEVPQRAGAEPDAVWLTAESLGDDDPALRAHPDLPAVFVFDAPLLAGWRLSGKRLVFLAETLGDLAARREVVVLRGAPARALADRRLAATAAPVPGFRSRAAVLDVVALHPWPWLARPHDGPLGSFSAWRKRARLAAADLTLM
jgi:deoxyribodipyrimidine photo-lyase